MAIQIRRGTDAQWESNKSNIVAGEPAITTDTGRFMVGTGSGTFAEFVNTGDLATAEQDLKDYSDTNLQTAKDYTDTKTTVEIYQASGYVVSGGNGLAGYGTATVCLMGDKARLDFAFKVTQGGSGGFAWGINSVRLNTINPNIPSTITPLDSPCGTCTYYRGGSVDGNLTGFGGTVNAVSGYPQLWGFGRIYNSSGENGVWGEDSIPSDTYIVGTAYGKIMS